MTLDLKQPLDLVLRRRAAYKTLSDVLTGDQLLQAMWMIEERDQSADRLTFLGFVGVTAEIFGIDNHAVSMLYIKLNKCLNLPSDQLPLDPLAEMLNYRGIKHTEKREVSDNEALNNQSPQLTGTSSSIFRAHDILGLVENELTQETIYQIGQALGSEVKERDCSTMIIARDERNSSVEIRQALIKGVLATGLNVIDLGIVPIPVLNFVIYHFEGRTGVMITGGHHSNEYNGLKMVVAGEVLDGEKLLEIKQRIENAEYAVEKEGNLEQNNTYINEYIGMICEDIQIKKPIKIVLDSGQGIASSMAMKLMQALDCKIIDLQEIVDTNLTDANCDASRPDQLTSLSNTVRQYQADIGFAFDKQGARLRVVDNLGKTIRPDRQIMLFAKNILASYPTSEIIHDTQSNGYLAKHIAKYGGRSKVCTTGSGFMRKILKTSGAKLAGDMHGHIYFNDRWFGFDDALYTASRLLEIISSETRASSDIFADLPESLNVKELSLELNTGENQKILEALINKADFPSGKISDIDGLRVDFPEGWILIRADDASPTLIFHFEVESEAVLKQIQDQLKLLLLQIKPDLNLPF